MLLAYIAMICGANIAMYSVHDNRKNLVYEVRTLLNSAVWPHSSPFACGLQRIANGPRKKHCQFAHF